MSKDMLIGRMAEVRAVMPVGCYNQFMAQLSLMENNPKAKGRYMWQHENEENAVMITDRQVIVEITDNVRTNRGVYTI